MAPTRSTRTGELKRPGLQEAEGVRVSQDGFLPQLAGQDLARSVLEACLKNLRFPSFMFAGPGGVGKRTAALLFAQAVNCLGQDNRPCGECVECRHIANLTHPDVKLVMPLKPEGESGGDEQRGKDRQRIIDETMKRYPEYALGQPRPQSEAKWQISIHAIHWLRAEMAYRPVRAMRKVLIVLDADQMNPIAANAFLKTLEEPQAQAMFILTTERAHKLLDTIRSRCQIVGFRYFKPDELVSALISRKDVRREQAEVAAELAEGSLRKALDCLEQPEEFLLPQALEFFSEPQPSVDACRILAEQADRAPIQSLIDSLLFLYRQALLAKSGMASHYLSHNPDVSGPVRQMELGLIRRRLEILLKARREFEYNVNKRLFLFALLTQLTDRLPRATAPRVS